MASFRNEATKALLTCSKREIQFPTSNSVDSNLSPPTTSKHPIFLAELFGSCVFGLKQLQNTLPKPIYAAFKEQVLGRKPMDKSVTDAIAHAVRIWAQERGATHFTHWFQPLTGATAEKHDSFLQLEYPSDGVSLGVTDLVV
jgi:glutamine synthetase type III